jgi:hypothetical protein
MLAYLIMQLDVLEIRYILTQHPSLVIIIFHRRVMHIKMKGDANLLWKEGMHNPSSSNYSLFTEKKRNNCLREYIYEKLQGTDTPQQYCVSGLY